MADNIEGQDLFFTERYAQARHVYDCDDYPLQEGDPDESEIEEDEDYSPDDDDYMIDEEEVTSRVPEEPRSRPVFPVNSTVVDRDVPADKSDRDRPSSRPPIVGEEDDADDDPRYDEWAQEPDPSPDDIETDIILDEQEAEVARRMRGTRPPVLDVMMAVSGITSRVPCSSGKALALGAKHPPTSTMLHKHGLERNQAGLHSPYRFLKTHGL